MEPEGASCTQNCWYKAVSRSVTGAPFCAPGYGSSWEWGSKGQRPTGVSRLFSLQRNGTGLELGTQGREHPGTCPVGGGSSCRWGPVRPNICSLGQTRLWMNGEQRPKLSQLLIQLAMWIHRSHGGLKGKGQLLRLTEEQREVAKLGSITE